MEKPFIRLLKSFAYALQGVAFLVRTQPNARLHLLAAAVSVCWCSCRISPAWVTEPLSPRLAPGANRRRPSRLMMGVPEMHQLATRPRQYAKLVTGIAGKILEWSACSRR